MIYLHMRFSELCGGGDDSRSWRGSSFKIQLRSMIDFTLCAFQAIPTGSSPFLYRVEYNQAVQQPVEIISNF